MAISSKIKRAIWEGLGELEAPNTFIGRAGEEYTTAMELATAMDIPYVAIKNFRVDANYNISCRIDRDYNITTGAFSKYLNSNHKFERYYIDADGLLKETSGDSFGANANIKFYFPGLELWGNRMNGFATTGPAILYAKNLVNVKGAEGFFAHNWRNGFGRAYIPNLNIPHENANTWYGFQLNNNSSAKSVAYVNADFYAHPRTVWARTKSGIKLDARIVSNFDCPNAVEDLSVNPVYMPPMEQLSKLTKTSGANWTGKANANEMLVGDGTVSMQAIETNTGRGIGIETTQGSSTNDFDFAIQFGTGGTIWYWEGDTIVNLEVPYDTGDVISIKRTGTLIEYQKNGVTIHTSTTPAPLTDMRIRTVVAQNGATVYDARVNDTPITWKDIENMDYVPYGPAPARYDYELNFTTPAPSTNPIDFYEVWLEELGVNDPEYRYFPRTEITAAGEIISGLKPNTTYALRLATVDTLYNGSGVHSDPNMRRFSNQVIFQTQSI